MFDHFYMDTSDIIDRLQKLQIEQNKLIEELIASKSDSPITKEDPEPAQQESTQRPRDKSKKLQAGDQIILLTSGVRSKKGDKARVTTKTKGNTIHFVVLRNGHSSHRKANNVRKPE